MDSRIYLTKQLVVPMELRDCDLNLIIEALKEKKGHLVAYVNRLPADQARIWELDRLINNLQDVLLNR